MVVVFFKPSALFTFSGIFLSLFRLISFLRRDGFKKFRDQLHQTGQGLEIGLLSAVGICQRAAPNEGAITLLAPDVQDEGLLVLRHGSDIYCGSTGGSV